MSNKRVVIIGATGMVGGIVLKICLDHPEIISVTVIGRHSTGMNHEKLKEIIINDFTDYTSLKNNLSNLDAAFYCLGAYTGTVPDDLFRQITVDYTLAFAECLHERSPQTVFCFLSGQGADPSEKSRVAFARYKGIAESGLLESGFFRIHIFRPGYIYPVRPRKEPNTFYTLFRFLYPLVRLIYPNIGISSEHLAAAMVHAGLNGTGPFSQAILENRDIRNLYKKDVMQ